MTTKKELEKRIEALEAEIALLRPRLARTDSLFGFDAATFGMEALAEQLQIQFDGRPSLR